MAHGNSFQEYVLEQLSKVPDIRARRMFGGWGLYRGRNFFGIISNERFYMKVNQKTKGRYIQAGMLPFQPRGSQILKSYYEVPVNVLDDAEELAQWARLSTD